MTGHLNQRSFETREGDKRTVMELLVDEIGPPEPAAFAAWAAQRAAAVATEQRDPPTPLDTTPYRRDELNDMRADIFLDRDAFAAKRRAFLGLA